MGLYGKFKRSAKRVGSGVKSGVNYIGRASGVSGILDTTSALRGANNQYRRNSANVSRTRGRGGSTIRTRR